MCCWPVWQVFPVNWFADQAVDCLWVQFSNYGYSRWGTPYQLSRVLKSLRSEWPSLRIAVCMHETHCLPSQLGWKGPVLSALQRNASRAVARQADLIFTTVPIYRKRVVDEYGAASV